MLQQILPLLDVEHMALLVNMRAFNSYHRITNFIKAYADQGIQGPTYHVLAGNIPEYRELLKEAHAQPMQEISHDIVPRVKDEHRGVDVQVSHGTFVPCEVKENADHTKDGTVDRFGRLAIKCRTGGWKDAIWTCTLFLIIFVVVQVQKNPRGLSVSLPTLIDSWFFDKQGLVLLALLSHLLLLKPIGCGNRSLSYQNASSLEIRAFYLSIYLVALGNGGYQPSIATFRADQFDEEDQREGVSKITFFSWILAICLNSWNVHDCLPTGNPEMLTSYISCLVKTVQSMEAKRYRDLNEVEVELFLKVKTIDYYTTVAKIKGLGHLPIVFYYYKKYVEDPSTIGHPVAIQKFYQDMHIFLFWSYGNSDDINDAAVSRLVYQDVKNTGAEVESVILQRQWNYFPHVSSQDMKRGFYERMEKELQGRQNTYYVGRLMAFKLTELNSFYAINLVCRYFASDKTSPPLPYVKLKPRMEKVRELGEIPRVEFPELRSITIKNSGEKFVYWYGIHPRSLTLALLGRGVAFVHGLEWVKHRRILSPSFNVAKLKAYADQGIWGPTYHVLAANILEYRELLKEAHAQPMREISHDIVPRVMPHYHKWYFGRVSILLAMYSAAMVVGATYSFVWTKGATTSGSHLGFRPSEGLTVKMVLGTQMYCC
eukprot:Gb_16376 [translate_table: standard]